MSLTSTSGGCYVKSTYEAAPLLLAGDRTNICRIPIALTLTLRPPLYAHMASSGHGLGATCLGSLAQLILCKLSMQILLDFLQVRCVNVCAMLRIHMPFHAGCRCSSPCLAARPYCQGSNCWLAISPAAGGLFSPAHFHPGGP